MERWLNITVTGGVIMSIGLTVYTFYRILVKKTFSDYDRGSKEYDKLSRKIWDGVSIAIMGTALIIGYYMFVIPYTLDIGYIITKEYPILEGTVTSIINVDEGAKVSIEGSDEIVIITNKKLKRGDIITVRYLPHLKTGELIE